MASQPKTKWGLLTSMKAGAASLLCVVLLALAPGCGGAGGTEPVLFDEIPEDYFIAENVVVKPTTKVLPNDGSVVISNLTPDSLTVSGSLPPIAVDDVLVSGLGEGLMRKVTSVTDNGGSLDLLTEDASFVEVFESADISYRRMLTPADIESIETYDNDIQIGGSSGNRPALAEFPIVVTNSTLKTGVDPAKVFVSYGAVGTLYMGVEGNISINSTDGFVKAEAYLIAKYDGSYSLKTGATVTVGSLSKRLATFVGSPVYLGNAGPVPIVLLPVLSFNLNGSGSISGGIQSSGDGEYGAKVGMVVEKVGGQYESHGVYEPARNGLHEPINYFATLSFSATPFNVEIDTSFNGIIGPTFKSDLPRFKFDITASTEDPTLPENAVRFKISALFAASIGAKAGLFDASIPLIEHEITSDPIVMYDETFNPGEGEIIISQPDGS